MVGATDRRWPPGADTASISTWSTMSGMETGGVNPLGGPGQLGHNTAPVPLPPFAAPPAQVNSPEVVWPSPTEPSSPAKKSRGPGFWILLVTGVLVLAAVGLLAIGVAFNVWSGSTASKNVPADSELLACYGRDGSKQPVPCSSTHYFEVYSAARYPADTPYPGAIARSAGLEICEEDFALHTGTSYYDLSSDLNYSLVFPSEDEWNAGDRLVLCVLHHLENQPLR